MDTSTMTPGGIMPVFGGSEREPGSFTNDVKRRDWNMAGTAYYATAEAFNLRVLRANKRKASGLKRSLWADSKANRKAYGVDSGNFKWTMPETLPGDDAPPWLKGLPSVLLEPEVA